MEHGKGIQLILQRVSDVWRDDTVNPFYKQYDYYISEWNVEITTENKNLLPCNVSITGYLGTYLAPGMYKKNIK